jgi:hypothetical protein
MTFYIYLYIISFFSYIFLDFLIKRGFLGNNFRNELIRFQNNQIEFAIYLFIVIAIISFIFMPDEVTYFLDKETEIALASIQDNNVNIHNPNINIPNSFAKAVASLGIGGTIAAGITTAGTLAKSGPIGLRLGTMAAGGAVAGGLFVAANYFNTILQQKAKPVSNDKTSDIIFKTKSVLDGNDNDSLNAVLGLFNINLILSICILYLLIVLAILFISSFVIENKLSLTFIKNIFGTRFHSFIMKILEYTTKTNKI